MAVDDPNPPPGSAPASTQEQQAPAQRGSAPLVDIEKDEASALKSFGAEALEGVA